MLADQARWPLLEHAWAIRREGDELVEPRLLRRGSAHSVHTPIGELRPGESVLHSHPSGSIEPTPEDLEWAEAAATMGHGFGIVAPWNRTFELLFIVAPRRPPAAQAPTWAKLVGPVLISLAWVGRRPRSLA